MTLRWSYDDFGIMRCMLFLCLEVSTGGNTKLRACGSIDVRDQRFETRI